MGGRDVRVSGRAVWETLTFLLNGIVFIVTGLEVPLLLRDLAPATAARLVGIGIVVSLVLVGVRALWIFPTSYLACRLRPDTRPTRLFAPSPSPSSPPLPPPPPLPALPPPPPPHPRPA